MSAASLERREASVPPEARGRGRDDVAMLVAMRGEGLLVHRSFRDLPGFLRPGDLVVINNSATLAAAVDGLVGEQRVQLRLSTPVSDTAWIVELRTAEGDPLPRAPLGTRVDLPAGAHAHLVAAYAGSRRLAVATLELGAGVAEYLALHGRPIRYGYVPEPWPVEAYQTVFALEPGSAEMPSAGRPFTTELVTSLVSRGVLVAPITLHTGVSSPERGEPPYPERYRVPETTARLVNAVHAWGGRVIAVGTTVVRGLETVAAPDGSVAAGEGSTGLVVTPERGLRAVDGLLTGWHEPRSSHLQLLEAAAGPDLLARSYAAASERGYLWHEFGDTHLILP
ncbi:MAG TPA: S-adenosylmethionine:tRNA ribosyltransferase-isomerase [Gaiellaceae bacterium]